MRFTAAILLIALCLPLQARSSAYDRYADTSRCLQLKSIASEFTTWKEEAKEKESDRTNLLKLADLHQAPRDDREHRCRSRQGIDH